jgi:hypothetical protein
MAAAHVIEKGVRAVLRPGPGGAARADISVGGDKENMA